jgi:hypothetical protein
MKTFLTGNFADVIFLQITKPVLIDVSEADYVAAKLNKLAEIDEIKGVQRPFIICETQGLSLTVETWKGEVITWKFTPGPYQMLLRKVFYDPANCITLTGESFPYIQIGY